MTDQRETRTPAVRKLNCWEFMGCGREPGGARVAELGICPAATETQLDGILGGVNAGRCCWAVAGTFCLGEPHGTFARRYETCRACPFFQKIQAEEPPSVLGAVATLLRYVTAAEAADRDRHLRVLKTLADPAVVTRALDNAGALLTGERHVTAFFSDLAGFSTIAAQLGPPALGGFLSEYLSAMTEVLRAEGGTLDKYVGDGIVAIFGAPVTLENDALSAARAALRMQHRLAELRTAWRERDAWCPAAWVVRMRIGLSSGLAKVGLMGTADFASYTMTGRIVNLGRWLERTCKTYGVPILVSETTRDLIAGEMLLRRVGTRRPKGDIGPEALYELLGPDGGVASERVRAAACYEAALDLSDKGHWSTAAKLLRRAARDVPDDRATNQLLHRCEIMIAERRVRLARERRPGRRLVDFLGHWLPAPPASWSRL